MWIYWNTILRLCITGSLICHFALKSSVPVRGRQSSSTSKKHTPAGSQFSRPLINAAVHRRHLTSPFSSPPLHSDTTSRQGVRNVRFNRCLSLALALSLGHTDTFEARCNGEKYSLYPKMASQLHLKRTRCTIVSYLLPPSHTQHTHLHLRKGEERKEGGIASGGRKKKTAILSLFYWLTIKGSWTAVDLGNKAGWGQHRSLPLPQYDWGLNHLLTNPARLGTFCDTERKCFYFCGKKDNKPRRMSSNEAGSLQCHTRVFHRCLGYF